MKCPACFNNLAQMQVGTLVVDVCQDGCGGIWFDAYELQQVDEQNEAAGEPLLGIRRDERIVVDPSRKRECPRCAGIKLYRHFFSAKRRIEVDECPNCGGYWLDAGELALVREEKAENSYGRLSREAPLPGSVIRYLYRLGSEHRKAQ